MSNARGKCQHCDTPIEFPVELAGTDADCPSCGMITRLFVPVAPAQKTIPRPVPAVPAKAARMATVEDALDRMGTVYFVGGFAVGFVFVADCFYALTDGHEIRAMMDIIYALAAMGGGWVLKTLTNALAEIIRLLRKGKT